MKQSLFKWVMAPLVACALLAPAQVMGQAVNIQAKGWHLSEVLPGVLCVNASGSVRVLGYAHIVKFESADSRLAGRGIAVLNQEPQADGTITFEGTGSLELGTWDSNGIFTRTDGGVWDAKFSGVVKVDGTLEYRFSGRGIGGSIDSLHIVMTATKASTDPTVPYLFSAKITGVAGK